MTAIRWTAAPDPDDGESRAVVAAKALRRGRIRHVGEAFARAFDPDNFLSGEPLDMTEEEFLGYTPGDQ